MSNMFDVVIIGGGPGGYVCAIKAAQCGLNVACIEGRGSLGGTCLNVGCIPSKALLEISEKYHLSKHLISDGILTGNVGFDFKKIMEKKDKIVSGLTQGIEGLFKKNKVTYIKGFAKFKDKETVVVNGEEVKAKSFVIATGSTIASLPNLQIDEQVIISSTGALALKNPPKKMVVIGAGVIGLEMASVYSRFETDVEVIEFLDKITPTMDGEVSKTLKRILESQGLKFKLSTKVLEVKKSANSATVFVEDIATGQKNEISCDAVLVSVGRKPYTDGLGLENIGVEKNERGFIKTNSHLQTNLPNIYAIGDVTVGPMLAHKAEEEGVMVAENLAGKKGHVNYDVIPNVIYTHPEVASVGKTEEELKSAGVEYNIGKFSMMANSRARAVDDFDGFVKVLACKKTDKILGCHIISRGAGDLIHEICVAMEFFASSEDIARTCHAHPTLNEAIKEACLAAFSKPLHS